MASATTPFTGSCSALPASKTVSSAGNSISSSIDSNTNVSNIITSTTEHSQISDFSYCLSSELDINMVFKITSIEGYRPQIPLSKMLQDPYCGWDLLSMLPKRRRLGATSISACSSLLRTNRCCCPSELALSTLKGTLRKTSTKIYYRFIWQ
ncbi:hypothetical protein BASA62_001312 [Batrachochytrium salamandrivorans]|nr:hypothetical protein BASA62_001312 [Batrachochytrium salamandrivorans]